LKGNPPISASQVARITGVSYWYPARSGLFIYSLPLPLLFPLPLIPVCNPGWPWTRDPPASASLVLELQAYATMPSCFLPVDTLLLQHHLLKRPLASLKYICILVNYFCICIWVYY
jgi:hypothetical protein